MYAEVIFKAFVIRKKSSIPKILKELQRILKIAKRKNQLYNDQN